MLTPNIVELAELFQEDMFLASEKDIMQSLTLDNYGVKWALTGSREFGCNHKHSDNDVIINMSTDMSDGIGNYVEDLIKRLQFDSRVYNVRDTYSNGISFNIRTPRPATGYKYNFIFLTQQEFDEWLGVTRIMKKLVKSSILKDEICNNKSYRVEFFELLKSAIRDTSYADIEELISFYIENNI